MTESAAPEASETATPSETGTPSETAAPSDAATDGASTDAFDATAAAAALSCTNPSTSATKLSDEDNYDQAVAFMNSPSTDCATAYSSFTCPSTSAEITDDPTQPMLACDPDGTAKYLLTPAIIEGTDLTSADYGIP